MADQTETRILSADDIYAADDIAEQLVFIPQWGGSVRIKAFSLQQALAISDKATRTDPRTGKVEQDQDMMNRLLVTEGIVEPKLDYDKLLEKSASALTLIVKAISDLSAMGVAGAASAAKSPETESNGAVQLLPGPRVGDDAG